jgi:hypothetical protein
MLKAADFSFDPPVPREQNTTADNATAWIISVYFMQLTEESRYQASSMKKSDASICIVR